MPAAVVRQQARRKRRREVIESSAGGLRFCAPCLTSNFLAESNLARTAAVVAYPSLLRPACSAMGSCFSYFTREEARPEQPSELPRHLWVARDGVSFHAHEDCEYIRRNRADEIWRRSRPDGSTGFFCFILRLCFFVSLPGQVPAVLPARRQGAELRKVAGRFALAFLEGLVACPAFF